MAQPGQVGIPNGGCPQGTGCFGVAGMAYGTLGGMSKRFLPLAEVAEILDVSAAQAYALVRSGDLPAIKVGGRGQWRVEATELEAYIQRMYAQTRALIDSGAEDELTR